MKNRDPQGGICKTIFTTIMSVSWKDRFDLTAPCDVPSRIPDNKDRERRDNVPVRFLYLLKESLKLN